MFAMREILSHLFRLGLPITVGRTGIIGMGITDLVVVGHLAADELAHLSLGLAIVGVLVHGGIALLFGVQVTSARALGAGDLPLAGLAWRRGLIISAVAGTCFILGVALVSLPFFVLLGIDPALAAPASRIATILSLSVPLHLMFIASTNFLEGLERPTPAAIAMWCAVGLNLALNLVLVPIFGAEGSAWTTLASRSALAVAAVGFILTDARAKAALAPHTNSISYGALMSIGIAAMTSSIVEAGAFSAMSLIAARISAEALATINLATGGLLTLVAMIALGFGSASAILIAQHLAEGRHAEAQRVSYTAIALNTVTFIAIGLLCVLFANTVAAMFTSGDNIGALFAGSMLLVALLMTPDCGQMVIDPSLRATGDNWFPTIARVLAFAGIAPSLAFWLVEYQSMGVDGVLIALIVGSGLAYLALLGRWAVVSRRVT